MCIPDPRPSDLVENGLPGDNSATPIPVKGEIEEAMKDTADSELVVNVVSLGLLHGVTVDEEANITLDIAPILPTCSLTDRIEYDMKYAFDNLANPVTINWAWLLPWVPEMIAEDGRE